MTNEDTVVHQVVADQAKFTSSPMLSAGQSYSFAFAKSGTFTYHDGANIRRTGKVIVKPGVSLTATPPAITFGAMTTLGGTVQPATAKTVTVDVGGMRQEGLHEDRHRHDCGVNGA